jgi:hypothetical protein
LKKSQKMTTFFETGELTGVCKVSKLKQKGSQHPVVCGKMSLNDSI